MMNLILILFRGFQVSEIINIASLVEKKIPGQNGNERLIIGE